MSGRILHFLKVYLIFALVAVSVNVMFMELIIAPLIAPEHQKIIAEYGWEYFISNIIFGATILFMLLSLVGTVLFLKTNYTAKRMGILSIICGFALEFAFMQPEWAQDILSLSITGDAIGAVIVSSLYWFIPWGIPTYILHKYLTK